jgi:hypothetical protein
MSRGQGVQDSSADWKRGFWEREVWGGWHEMLAIKLSFENKTGCAET